MIGPFDSKALVYPWKHPDPEMDVLASMCSSWCRNARKSSSGDLRRHLAIGQDEPLPEGFLARPNRPFRISTSLGTVARSPRKSSSRVVMGARVLLVASKTGYQVREFYGAAERLGIDLVLATDRCHVLDDPWGDQAAAVHFERPEAGIQELEARGAV